MTPKLATLVGAVAVLAVAVVPAAAMADEPAEPLDGSRAPADVGRRLTAAEIERLRSRPGLGRGAIDGGAVEVIVQLRGRPVSAFDADSIARTGERLPAAVRQDLAADVAAQQGGVRERIGAIGGRIAAAYQHVLNGFRLTIPRNRVAQLARLPGVESVAPVPVYEPALVNTIKYAKANKAWAVTDALGNKLTGEGLTIAVIDTGIDYFHADFGGPGTAAAYDSDDPTQAGPSFPTAKVIAGYDLAGDDYNASLPTGYANATPSPDEDPLDCNGHGTHVAGIAAGFGVERSGGVNRTYTGAYNGTALNNTNWVVPPGVAPKAELVALKIFGCSGTSNLVVDAIEMAVSMGNIDVINMSLGSAFARSDELIATTVNNAVNAGIVVVGSAGNLGRSAYIHGGVTTGDAGISVAAVDGRSAAADYKYLASFTAGGPRNGDSALKPDITAPGVGVLSAWSGTGSAGTQMSGTSMSAPVVAGAAALVLQKNPSWTPGEVKAALMGTAGAGKKKFRAGQYDPRLAGSGALVTLKAAKTAAFVLGPDANTSSLSFGYDELSNSASGYSETRELTIVNRGSVSITYKMTGQFVGSSHAATLSFSPKTVTVAPNSSAVVQVTLALAPGKVRSLPGAFVGELISDTGPSSPAAIYQPVNDIAGVVKATPTSISGNRYPLRMPFLSVPRGVSDISVTADGGYSLAADSSVAERTVTLTNSAATGNHAGAADVFAWGLSDADDAHDGSDIRDVGIQQFACTTDDGCAADDRLLVFAVNTWGRWSNLSTEELDILIDVDGDTQADFAVYTIDFGLQFDGRMDGTQVVMTCALDPAGRCDPFGLLDGFVPGGQHLNGSTTFLPTQASWLGLSAAPGDSDFSYAAYSLNVLPSAYTARDNVADTSGNYIWAPWDAWHPAVETGELYNVAFGGSVNAVLRAELANNGTGFSPKGWLVVSVDDASGEKQAERIELGSLP